MADYTNYDYDEIVARVTEKLRDSEGWGDAYDSSMGQTLIRMIADVTDNLHYMLERRTLENYLFTAKTQSAVFARASELGYRPRRVRANTGTLTFALEDGNGNPIPTQSDILIPSGTTFNYAGRTFTSLSGSSILAGETSTDIPVSDGVLRNITIPISELENNQIVIENYQNIDEDSLRVFSGGSEYSDISRDENGYPTRRVLSFLGADDEFYDIRYDVNGMRVVFGDGTFGKTPSDDITITYLEVSSINEPVISLNNIFSTDFVAADSFGTEYESLITNTQKIYGGDPIESISRIKENARTYTKTNGRALTSEDTDYWVKESNIGGIIDSVTMGERELNTLIHNTNNVYINYLKQDASELSVEEETALRNYLKSLLPTAVHPVFRAVDNLLVQARLHVRKNDDTKIADSEFYDKMKQYLENYFAIEEGAIGREIQHSELVCGIQNQQIDRGGRTIDIVDFAKIELDILYPLSVPLSVNDANITISNDYVPSNSDQFGILLQDQQFLVDIESTDSEIDILNKMRDEINAETPYIAKVVFNNIAVDAFGNPLPLEIQYTVGDGMLVGEPTPYRAPDELLIAPTVGSVLATFVEESDVLNIQHFYYEGNAGRRPMIPLRSGTEITFTAPTDTAVEVYVRDDLSSASTETLLTTLAAGELYNQVFGSEHGLQFEYLNDSSEDVIVDISYPNIDSSAFGLNVSTPDGFGFFKIENTGGDIVDFVDLKYNIRLPPLRRNIEIAENQIYPESLDIIRSDGRVVFNSRSDGRFMYPDGSLVPSGRVDFLSSNVVIPQELEEGEYYIRYKQNKYQNIKTDGASSMVLLPISEDPRNPNNFSRIKIER